MLWPKTTSCIAIFLTTLGPSLGCFNRQASQLYLKRLSGTHPELAQATNGFDENFLRRISKLSPMTKLKINFCNGLLGNTSPIIHTLGDAVNCKDVFSRFGKDRKSKTKGQLVPEVSNFIEDDINYDVNDGSYNPGNNNVYGSDEPWSPKPQPPEKPFISETENFNSEPDVPQFNGGNEEEFQPIPTQITHDYPQSVPLSETTFSVISADPQIPGNVEPTPMNHFVGSEIFQKIPTSSENPWTSTISNPNPTNWPQTSTINSHWSSSTQTPQPYDWTTEATTPTTKKWKSSTVNNWTPSPQDFNNWDSHSWTTENPSKSWTTKFTTKAWTTKSPTIKSKVWTTEKPASKYWTTFAPIKSKPTKSKVWTTFASKKIATKKPVLPAPSDPTQPLFGNFQVTSNPWPSQFNSDLLNQVGKNMKKVQDKVFGRNDPQEKKETKENSQTTSKSYFDIGNKPALEFDEIIDLPSFTKDSFSSYGKFEEEKDSMFAKYENGRNTKSFLTEEEAARPKKEIKANDQYLYLNIGHDTESHQPARNVLSYEKPGKSLADAQLNAITKGSEAFRNTFPEEPSEDIIELYLPDPLAPGHPMGNGNHGWAPIEEWAESQRADIDQTWNNPSWANSEITTQKSLPPHIQSWAAEKQQQLKGTHSTHTRDEWEKREITGFEYEKVMPEYKPVKTITTIKKLIKPVAAKYPEQDSMVTYPTTQAPRISSTLDQATETVVKSLLKTNSYPIPVTPRYNKPFANFASLDLSHLAGPTGPPGIAMFHTNPPIKTAQQLQLGNIALNSNSHYMKQNPFLASPRTTSAPSVKRNVDQSDFWSYNPVTESSVVKSYNPYSKHVWEPDPIRSKKSLSFDKTNSDATTLKPTIATSSAQITGYSYKNVHFPNTGVNSGYDSYHYKTTT